MADFDAWLVDSFSTTDGIWGLCGVDDDRPVATWSGAHLERALSQRALSASRVAACEWAVADVEARGANAAIVANAHAQLAAARAEWSAWDAQVARIDRAR